MLVLLVIVASVSAIFAVRTALGRPPSAAEREKQRQLENSVGNALNNIARLAPGALGGTGPDFGPPPPISTYAPDGDHVVKVDPDDA